MTMFDTTPRAADLRARLLRFMDEHIYPNEAEFQRQVNTGDRWAHVQLIEDLKPRARAEGLWNLFCRPPATPAGSSAPA